MLELYFLFLLSETDSNNGLKRNISAIIIIMMLFWLHVEINLVIRFHFTRILSINSRTAVKL